MKNLFDKFQNLNGVTFIAVNGYEAKTTGEIANHILNVGLSIENAKLKDIQTLKSVTPEFLQEISIAKGIAIEICKTAHAELLASAVKNASANIDDRSNQSKGQTDAYVPICKGVKFHKDTATVHIHGQAINKVVIKEGEYKVVKSQPKTIAKNAIQKALNLRALKYRNFILSNIKSVTMQGDQIVIN